MRGGERFSQVRIVRDKITRYLLNTNHAEGRGKAEFFTSIGFTPDRPEELEDILSSHPQTAEFKGETPSFNGVNYTFTCDIKAPNGRVFCIVSVWFIEQGKTTPRLITAYPAKKRKRS